MQSLKSCKIIYFLSRILLLIFLVDMYFVKTNMSIHLLKYDVKDHFSEIDRWPIVAIILLVILVLESLFNYLVVTGKVKLRYDISILKPHTKTIKIYVTNLMRIVNIFVILVSFFGLIIVGFEKTFPPSNKLEWTDEKIIGHSFGEIDGETYTGCLEAFEEKYSEGLRTFEVDFARTSDGFIVLRHDWSIDLQDFSEEGYVATKDEFVKTKILGKYTPLTLEDLLLIMKEHNDIWIVTDSKNSDPISAKKDFQDLVATAKDIDCEECLDRFVIQFYNEEMYEAIRDVYDFKGYIFTLYMRWDSTFDEFMQIARWCAANDVHVITMWSDLAKNEDVITYARKYDIDIYVHTVNDINEARSRMYSGVKGIYTDAITPGMLK